MDYAPIIVAGAGGGGGGGSSTQAPMQQPPQLPNSSDSQWSRNSRPRPQPAQTMYSHAPLFPHSTQRRQNLLIQDALRNLVSLIDPAEKLDADVETLLQDLANDFVTDTIKSAAVLARHRGSDSLDLVDGKLSLKTKWNIEIPGFGEDAEPLKMRRPVPTRAYQARAAAVHTAIAEEALAMRGGVRKRGRKKKVK
ncbi:transcription initiation factor TFIID subunit A-domain-containing protein [Zopfochytrium polystomum]|nr:transcription initiation factor TFIID subunit A-domain-containing protein [Zopfochytrium polystomum]